MTKVIPEEIELVTAVNSLTLAGVKDGDAIDRLIAAVGALPTLADTAPLSGWGTPVDPFPAGAAFGSGFDLLGAIGTVFGSLFGD